MSYPLRHSIFLLALLLALAGSRAAAAQCTAAASYGNAQLTNEQVLFSNPGVQVVASGDLNTDIDSLHVEIYGGLGPGVYVLTGENYDTCQLCVFVKTETGDAGYLATGGTVTITQVTPDVILDVASLTAEHVEIDPGTFESTPHPDGCTTAITSATLDTSPAPVPALGGLGIAVACGALALSASRRLGAAGRQGA